MGLLNDEYPRADRGNNGYGFNGFYDAMSVVDQDNPCLGETFKISGQIYELQEVDGKLKFIKND